VKNALVDVCVTGSCNGVPLFFSNEGLIVSVQDANETELKYSILVFYLFIYAWFTLFLFKQYLVIRK